MPVPLYTISGIGGGYGIGGNGNGGGGGGYGIGGYGGGSGNWNGGGNRGYGIGVYGGGGGGGGYGVGGNGIGRIGGSIRTDLPTIGSVLRQRYGGRAYQPRAPLRGGFFEFYEIYQTKKNSMLFRLGFLMGIATIYRSPPFSRRTKAPAATTHFLGNGAE